MAFRLEQGERVPAGVRRIVAEQLDRAIEALESTGDDRDTNVHEARKCMKRLRAAIRLVRQELGDEVFHLENACYRDAARQLAGVRDAAVLLEALEGLIEFAGGRVRRTKFATVSRWLVERRDAMRPPLEGADEAYERVLNDLRWARRRLDEWPLAETGWKTLQAGVRSVYARGRRQFELAFVEPADETFHEWRKWAKYHWYHVQILRELWPDMMTALADELDELGEVLGQDHDLTVLRHTIMAEMSRPIRASTLQTLLELIDDRQTHLRERAHRLGRRLYVERPQDFSRRFQGYWRAWRAEAPPPESARVAAGPLSPEIELIADYGCHTGEGPLWHPLERRLYWVDIPAGRLFRYDPARGTHEPCFQAPAAVGGFTVQADGALLLFMAAGAVAVWRDGELTYLVRELPEERATRFNDVIADPAGRVFCGTMPGPTGKARLYRLDPDGTFTVVLEDVGLANGMGFSPDRQTFYFTDSRRGIIQRFAYDEGTGDLSAGSVFVDTSAAAGVPDGMTVDAEGYIWSARWDGGCLVRYAPDGQEVQRIAFPARKVSAVTFGGEGQREMYVTTAGGQNKEQEGDGAGCLFRVVGAGRGLPEFLSRIGP